MSSNDAPAGSNARGWGGARPGSGQKPQSLSANQVQLMLEAAERRAKKEGRTLDDVLLDIVYDPSGSKKDVLAAIKLFKDKTMAQISEGGEADRALGPAVFLPAQHPRLQAVEGGKAS